MNTRYDVEDARDRAVYSAIEAGTRTFALLVKVAAISSADVRYALRRLQAGGRIIAVKHGRAGAIYDTLTPRSACELELCWPSLRAAL